MRNKIPKTLEVRKQEQYDGRMAKKRKQTVDWPARLRKLRVKLGLSQAKAAKRIRVSWRTWAGWESGERAPTGPLQLLLELLENEKI